MCGKSFCSVLCVCENMSRVMITPEDFIKDTLQITDFNLYYAKKIIDQFMEKSNLPRDEKIEILSYLRETRCAICNLIWVYRESNKFCIDEKFIETCARILIEQANHNGGSRLNNCKHQNVSQRILEVFYTRVSPQTIVRLMLRGESDYCANLAKYASSKFIEDDSANDFIEHIVRMNSTKGIPFSGEVNTEVLDAVYEIYMVFQKKNDEAKQENSISV